jgi:hypothetical protein
VFFGLIAEHEGSTAMVVLLLGVVASVWFGIAVKQENVVSKTSIITIHQSPDNYQYITENGEPVNITDMLGKIATDGQVVKKTEYETEYCGITGFKPRPTYEFVDQPKVEEEK